MKSVITALGSGSAPDCVVRFAEEPTALQQFADDGLPWLFLALGVVLVAAIVWLAISRRAALPAWLAAGAPRLGVAIVAVIVIATLQRDLWAYWPVHQFVAAGLLCGLVFYGCLVWVERLFSGAR